MKFFVTKICVLAAALTVLGMTAAADLKAEPIVAIQELAPQLSSPEHIARYIFKNFLVDTDDRNFGSEEYWQSPEELLLNGRGDCEDFALFASELLKANGVTAFLVNIYGKKFAHTVCVFKENGKYNVIDGDEVKRYEANDLPELFSKIYPHWNKAAMVAYHANGNCGKILKVFQK